MNRYSALPLYIRLLILQIVLAALGRPAMVMAQDADAHEPALRVLRDHCVKCHNADDRKGNLVLDRAPLAMDDLQLILDAVAGPEAPMPKDAAPLSESEVDALRAWIEAKAPLAEGLVLYPSMRADLSWWSLQPPTRPRPSSPNSEWCLNPVDQFVLDGLKQNQLEPSGPASQLELARRAFLAMLGTWPTPRELREFQEDPAVNRWSRLIDRLMADPRYGERWAQHWLDVIRWAETCGYEVNAERERAWPYRDWVIAAFNVDMPYDRFIFEQLAGDTVEQDAALGFLVAGPANLPGQIGEDELSIRQARQDALDEVITTVSQTLFGLTVGCARCHDHKFDPIQQRDYYALQAVFAGLQYGTRRLRGPENDAWAAQAPAATARVAQLTDEFEVLRLRHGLRPPLEDFHTETFGVVEVDAVRMRIEATCDGQPASLFEFEVWSAASEQSEAVNVALADNGGSATASSFALENQTRHPENLIDGRLDASGAGWPWKAAAAGPAWIEISLAKPRAIDRVAWKRDGGGAPADCVIEARRTDGQWIELANAGDRIPALHDTRPAESISLRGMTADELRHLTSARDQLVAARRERERLQAGPQTYAASFAAPDATWLLHRGDPMQRRELIQPGPPSCTGGFELPSDASESDRRVAFARAATRPDHPLTARVMVNRIWQQHFGQGLVSTPSDFGKMGHSPSHPELLDWLASELVRSGWSLKHIQRLILESRTFQQSNRPRSEALAVDAESRWLWRFPPRRVEAEVIRDSILANSGNLNTQRYGVGFDFFHQKGGLSDYISHEAFDSNGWRRMIYATKIRMQAVDIFSAFDCPDAGQAMAKRNRSTTALQALSLFNSPFVTRQAGMFAERLRREAGQSLERQVDWAMQLTLGRSPTAEESARLVQLASSHGLEQACRVLWNSNEFLFVP